MVDSHSDSGVDVLRVLPNLQLLFEESGNFRQSFSLLHMAVMLQRRGFAPLRHLLLHQRAVCSFESLERQLRSRFLFHLVIAAYRSRVRRSRLVHCEIEIEKGNHKQCHNLRCFCCGGHSRTRLLDFHQQSQRKQSHAHDSGCFQCIWYDSAGCFHGLWSHRNSSESLEI